MEGQKTEKILIDHSSNIQKYDKLILTKILNSKLSSEYK